MTEFEELKQIWDSQNGQPLYAINEKALHSRILSKKKLTLHIANVSELLLIIVNSTACFFILGMNSFNTSANVFMYLIAVWMLGCALFLLVSRIRRINRSNRFDRSMLGDLDHAISVATYQVRLSQLMLWNILPIGIVSLLGIWEGGKSIWIAAGTLIFFVLAYYAGGWEHTIYKGRKRELEILQDKLKMPETTDPLP